MADNVTVSSASQQVKEKEKKKNYYASMAHSDTDRDSVWSITNVQKKIHSFEALYFYGLKLF